MSIVRQLIRGLSLACVLVPLAAATDAQVTAHPQARIIKKIDNAEVILRPSTTSPRITHADDLGRLDPDTRFKHMMLVLKNTDEQEFALSGLLDQQQDRSSPNYHKWMTPETFGSTFGTAPTDLAAITSWLRDAGFTVEQVTRGARIIEFSGTSGQVEAAFHTEMHRYALNGENQIANSLDLSIPSALAEVVLGVASLNDFNPRNHMLNPRRVVRGTDGQMYPVLPGTASPDYTAASSGAHYVGAGDIATIFNTTPLLAAGIDGTGVKIGIIGQTDILLSDIQIYRTLFNLPPNDPTFTRVGADPGTIADDGESDLDVELSGGAAPGASINFVTSGNSYFGGGIDAAGVYLVESNSADIISLSYGICEASYGSTGNAFYNALWEQAASQGQTVFVSSGDSGPATCDSSTAAYETGGYAVNALASTPFNVAVGGTQFNEGTAIGVTQYWGPAHGAPYSTALGYIPEAPLDESRFGDSSWPSQVIFGGGSGISLYYRTPSFQTGPGVPTTDPSPNAGSISPSSFVVPGPHRYLPDVSLISSVYHDSTVYCSEGSCKINADGTVAGLGLVGGTSVAAPTMAGLQALINQKNGGRQGNANYFYYRLAAAQSQTNCISASYVTTAGCSFHDGQVGTTNVPSNAAGTSFIGWSAGPGYDLALGLGSPDVSNLASAWSTVSFNATATSFTLSPTATSHGAAQNVTIAVAPISGSGTPTGDVSIVASSTSGAGTFTKLERGTTGKLSFTLSGGTTSGTLSGLPGGTYSVYAHYAGDTTYGGSNSAPISVTISPEASILSATPYLLGSNGALTQTTSFPYGANVYLNAQVAGASGTGTPTGAVTFNLIRGTTPLAPFTSQLDSFGNTYFDAGLGYANYDIMPTAPVLSPSSYTAAVTYSGDTSFHASNALPIPFTITAANQPLNLRAVTAEVNSGAPATFNASISTISPAAGGLPATGTVTLTDTTTGAILGTATLANGAAVFTTSALTTAGSHAITATYSGDSDYLTETATTTITVGGAASTLTLAANTLSAPVGTSITLTATAPTGATGTVFFYDNGVSLGGASISATTLTAALTITTFAAGTHAITATSSGNSTQAAASSSNVVLTILKNSPTIQLTTQRSDATQSTVAMNAVLLPFPRGAAGNNPPPTGAVRFLDGTSVLGTAPAVYLPGGYNNYVASFTTQALPPGPHSLTASYIGDTNFSPATSTIQTLNIGLTTPTLTTSTTSVGSGATFTLSDRIVPQVATTALPGGMVTFYDGVTSLGSANVAGGIATLATAVLVGVGTHSVTAVYSGDTNFYTSTTSATTVTVVQATATPVLTLSATSVQVGTGVTLTATAPPHSTGTVTFLDNGASLGTSSLAGTIPVATLTVTSFGARSHPLTVAYSGDANFLPGTSQTTLLTVSQNTPTLQLVPLQNTPTASTLTLSAILTPMPSGARPVNPAPTGSVQYSDGANVLGLATLIPLTDGSGTFAAPFTSAILMPGPHAVTATYLGDTNYAATTTASQSVGLGLTTLTLTSSNTSIAVGSPFLLTANITPLLSATTSIGGTVTFTDGTSILGSSLVIAGSASITVSLAATASSAHTIMAVYSGDANFFTSAAPAITITTVVPAIAASVNPGSLTITRGSSATAVVSLMSTANYAGTIMPTCIGLPASSTCTFSPAPVIFNGSNSTQTTTVTIGTTAPITTSRSFLLPALFSAALIAFRRKQLTLRSRHLLVLAITVFGLMEVTGCGSTVSAPATVTGGTPTGTSIVTLNFSAIGSTPSSPATQSTAVLTLTIQ